MLYFRQAVRVNSYIYLHIDNCTYILYIINYNIQ